MILLATGGTASSVEKMLLENNKKITGLAVVVELLFLKGREKIKLLSGFNCHLLINHK